MQQPLHFVTSNEALAYGLISVGFRLVTIMNVYTAEMLDHIGFNTAAEAKEAGKPGQIRYVIERNALLPATLKAWDATGETLKKGQSITLMMPPEEAIVIVRGTMRGHEPFKKRWKEVPAMYLQKEDGEVIKSEKVLREVVNGKEIQRSETHPGFKLVSEGLTKAQREHIFE